MSTIASALDFLTLKKLRRSPLTVASYFGNVKRVGSSKSLKQGTKLHRGDRIQTFLNSALRVCHTGSKGYLLSGQHSLFKVCDRNGEREGSCSAFDLSQGSLYHGPRFPVAPRHTFYIVDGSSPSSLADCRAGLFEATEFGVWLDPNGGFAIAVRDGAAVAISEGNSTELSSGEVCRIEPGKPPGDISAIDEELKLYVESSDAGNEIANVACHIDPHNMIRAGGRNFYPDVKGVINLKVPIKIWRSRNLLIEVCNAAADSKMHLVSVPTDQPDKATVLSASETNRPLFEPVFPLHS